MGLFWKKIQYMTKTRYKVVQDKLVAMQQTKLKPMLVYHSENPTALKKRLREWSQSFGKLIQMPK